MTDPLWDPAAALPRVYCEGEEEPEGVWNPLLDLEELGLSAAPGDAYVGRAKELLEARWKGRRLAA